TSDTRRPLLLRVARKWYSWAGVALTVTAAYLAFDGQLRLDGVSQLQAAPPAGDREVSCESNLPPAENGRPAGATAPFVPPRTHRDAVKPSMPSEPEILSAAPGTIKPFAQSPAGKVLDAYLKNGGVIRANLQETPAKESPNVPVPPP